MRSDEMCSFCKFQINFEVAMEKGGISVFLW